MKGKTFFLILLLGCALAAALTLVSRQASKSTAPTDLGAGLAPAEQSSNMAADASTLAVPPVAGLRPGPAAARADEEPVDPTSSEAALDEIQKQLDAGDPASLRMIAVHLRHDKPAVRQAAREALREAGARDTVPDIQMAADATTDPREATELLDLIDYINLPTLKELENSSEVPSEVKPSTRPPRSRRSQRNSPATPATQPLPVTGQPTADQLAQLQAENEQLKRENQEMKEMLNRLLPPK